MSLRCRFSSSIVSGLRSQFVFGRFVVISLYFRKVLVSSWEFLCSFDVVSVGVGILVVISTVRGKVVATSLRSRLHFLSAVVISVVLCMFVVLCVVMSRVVAKSVALPLWFQFVVGSFVVTTYCFDDVVTMPL